MPAKFRIHKKTTIPKTFSSNGYPRLKDIDFNETGSYEIYLSFLQLFILRILFFFNNLSWAFYYYFLILYSLIFIFIFHHFTVYI